MEDVPPPPPPPAHAVGWHLRQPHFAVGVAVRSFRPRRRSGDVSDLLLPFFDIGGGGRNDYATGVAAASLLFWLVCLAAAALFAAFAVFLAPSHVSSTGPEEDEADGVAGGDVLDSPGDEGSGSELELESGRSSPVRDDVERQPVAASSCYREGNSEATDLQPSSSSRRRRPRLVALLLPPLLVVACCGALHFSAALLVATRGFVSVQASVDVASASAVQAGWMLRQARELAADDLSRAVDLASKVRVGIRDELVSASSSSEAEAEADYCPNNPALANSSAAGEVKRQAQRADEYLRIFEEISPISSAILRQLDAAIATAAAVQLSTEKIHVTAMFPTLLLLCMPMCLVPVLLVAVFVLMGGDRDLAPTSGGGGNVDHRQRRGRFLRWIALLRRRFLFPAFAVLVALYWIVALVLMAVAVVSCDFCLPETTAPIKAPSSSHAVNATAGGPDDTVLHVVRRLLGGQDANAALLSHVHGAVSYYTSSCTEGTPPMDFFAGMIPELTGIHYMVNNLAEVLEGDASLQELSLYCGNPELSVSLWALVASVQNLLASSLLLLGKASDLASCRRMSDLYVQLVHVGMCTHLPEAVFWLTACFLAMAFTGTVVIAAASKSMGIWLRCRRRKRHQPGKLPSQPGEEAATVVPALHERATSGSVGTALDGTSG